LPDPADSAPSRPASSAAAAKPRTGPRHIGIVGVSPEGSSLCYREVLRYASTLIGDVGHPTVSVHNLPFERYLSAVERDDWHTVGELLKQSAAALAAGGAEFAICPDNVMQHGIYLAEHGSALPWLTMTEIVASAVSADSRKIVGLIGTRMVTLGSAYQTHLGLKQVKVIVPDLTDAQAIDSIIFEELVHGVVRQESRETFAKVIGKLQEKGAEGLIVGFSESGLIIDGAVSSLPIYDPVGLLAHASVMRSVAPRI